MSHEIRTPLNGILGFTELLIRGADGGNEQERIDFLKTIRSSGKHLLQLLNDVLDISKIEAGQLQVETITCSPHQILAEVVSVLRVPARQKGITLDYRWESGIPETIQSDPHRLKQLLMNLVNNAIKFTERRQRAGRRQAATTVETQTDVAVRGPRHRHRHPPRKARNDLPAVRAGRYLGHPQVRRHGLGPGDQLPHCPVARRRSHRRQQRRPRQRVHRDRRDRRS